MAKMRGLSGSQETYETQIGTNGIAEGLDAIVTVSALHWLEPKTLEHLYRDLHALVKPGGYCLDSDPMRLGARSRLVNGVEAAKARRVKTSKAPDAASWEEWWDAAPVWQWFDEY